MKYDARVLTGAGVLAAVADSGSFSRAAEALGLTPSGVSRAVARLEGRLGVRLFDRTPRSVTLTEEGRRFHAQLMPLIASIEEAATEISHASVAVSGRLRVSIDPWFARMLLAPRMVRFMKLHELLTVDMVVSNHQEEMMTGVDVAIRFGPMDDSSLISRKLLETRVITCAAPTYLQKHGVPRTPDDLLHHEALLFRDPQTGRPFPWEFARKGKVIEVDVRGRFTTDDPTVAIAACVAGQGVFQSLELGLGPWLKGGKLVQILTEWGDERYPLYAYHHSRHHPPAKIRAFLDFVKEIAAE